MQIEDTNVSTDVTTGSSPETVSPAPSSSDASAAPSPATPSDATPAASSPAPDASTASSPVEADPKAGLLAAVKKAVEPKKPDAVSEQAKPVEDAKALDPNALPELTPEEIKSYTPSAQTRIKTLVSERNTLREQVREIEPFRAFMQEKDLSQEDLAFGLQALATLRQGDYEGFLQQVHPFVQLAMEYTGRALPPDLAEMVKQGRMTADVAVNVTKQRYDLGNARQRLERQDAEQAQQYEENARQVNRSTVAAWEQQVKASDPDYARKLDVAKAYVASIRAEYGDPETPEDALAVAKEAYRRASESMKAVMPPRAPTQMSPSGVQRSPNSGAVSSPKTLMEAAMQGLERARQSRAP